VGIHFIRSIRGLITLLQILQISTDYFLNYKFKKAVGIRFIHSIRGLITLLQIVQISTDYFLKYRL
jgi:hypothetical protein